MKKLAILLTVAMCILICKESIILSETSEPTTYEVEKLLQFTDDLDLKLSNWQITIKENREIIDIARFIDNMSGYKLTKDTDNPIKWSGNRQEMSGIDESILLVRTNEKENKYQISYTISFDSENSIKADGLHAANKKLKTITKDLFTRDAQYFSCIEVWNNGKIDIAYFLKKAELNLNMTIYDEVNEPILQTWTGWTAEWENSLRHHNKKINCQIAIKKGIDDRTTIQIGTPILINEY